MAKRKLTKQQKSRISKRHSNQLEYDTKAFEDTSLGPEQEGIVIAHHGKQVEVEANALPNKEGQMRLRCHIRANLETLVTGDSVVFQQGEQSAVVTGLRSRRNTLNRPDKYGKLKPVASNVDQLLIIVSPLPEPFSGLIDRYIAAAENADISPILIFNKTDLMKDAENETIQKNTLKIDGFHSLYSSLGYSCLFTAAKSKTADGMKNLEAILKDKTSVFVGQSGVGKSSLIKTLLPEESIAIGELSDAVVKGKHTTTHSELFHFPFGGHCIDSPGIREFGMWHLSEKEVTYGFKEIRNLAGQCKFRDCKHQSEPQCAVLEALDSKELHPQRLESYFRIIHSLDDVSMQ